MRNPIPALTLLLASALPAMAQTEAPLRQADSVAARHAPATLPPDPPATEATALPFLMAAPGLGDVGPWDAVPCGASWRLHEGFNAQLSLSVAAAFGRHAPRGAGFSQSASFAYAVPLTQRLSVAAGLYARNTDWGAFHQTDVGLSAVAAYRVNPSVSLYAYATKNFLPRHDARPGGPFPLYLPPATDRIGAMAEFKLGQNAAIQISVEHSSSPAPRTLFHSHPAGSATGLRPYGW